MELGADLLAHERELLQTLIDSIPVMITMYEPSTNNAVGAEFGKRFAKRFGVAANTHSALGYDALEPFLLLDAAVVAFEDGDRSRSIELAEATRAAMAATGQILDPDDAAEEEWLRSLLLVIGV